MMMPTTLKVDEAADSAKDILNIVIKSAVNDYYIAVGRKPFTRRQGFFSEVHEAPVIDQDKLKGILKFLLGNRTTEADQKLESKEAFHFSGSLSSAVDGINISCRYRAILVNTLTGPELTVRVLDRNLLELDRLGLDPNHHTKIVEALQRNKGLILVTGPTGAGKSTTLAAMIQHLIDSYPYHVVTLEDPVEFILSPQVRGEQPAYSLVTQRSVGVDCATYQQGMLDALRMKPDVIAVGEIRDSETMRAVIAAAETGHLIIGTMHASTVYQALDRILSQAGGDSRLVAQMLSSNLLCVIAQNLLPTTNSTESNPERALCYEVLFRTPELAQHFFQKQTVSPRDIKELIEQGGGISWNTCLNHLVDKRKIHPETASLLKTLE